MESNAILGKPIIDSNFAHDQRRDAVNIGHSPARSHSLSATVPLGVRLAWITLSTMKNVPGNYLKFANRIRNIYLTDKIKRIARATGKRGSLTIKCGE